MFDPFFGIASIGAPIALMFLKVEARMNPTTVPSVGTCLVALFAAYGVFVWLLMIGVALFGQTVDEGAFRILEGLIGVIAGFVVGVPFLVSARRRRRRASSGE
jgi:hypothetical protein